ncbi:hypothetical protein TSAR_011308 [Trichomalopsis sarcophagae]|uniref:Uncharacterized protein n=1 Tax=Trichomalopsis sarcophagae TaxID=543379 RepID=A0A232EGH0_9HYME|nr:hypothetical protein TSAR_011308 [Trichomalopsis sarcophagae]
MTSIPKELEFEKAVMLRLRHKLYVTLMRNEKTTGNRQRIKDRITENIAMDTLVKTVIKHQQESQISK